MDKGSAGRLGGFNSRKGISKKRATQIAHKANRIRWAAHRAKKKTNEQHTEKT